MLYFFRLISGLFLLNIKGQYVCGFMSPAFNLTPLINMSVFVQIPQCYYLYSFILQLEIELLTPPAVLLVSRVILRILGFFVFSYEILIGIDYFWLQKYFMICLENVFSALDLFLFFLHSYCPYNWSFLCLIYLFLLSCHQ